jgi:DNA-binding MarR family transcriptional regulator
LEWVYQAESTLPAIYVQHVIMKSEVASPAALHRALRILSTKGFLSIVSDTEDKRRRHVRATPKARRMLEKLSIGVLKSLRK